MGLMKYYMPCLRKGALILLWSRYMKQNHWSKVYILSANNNLLVPSNRFLQHGIVVIGYFIHLQWKAAIVCYPRVACNCSMIVSGQLYGIILNYFNNIFYILPI